MSISKILFNRLKAADPFFLLAGPNVIESEEHTLKLAKHIKIIALKLGLPLAFKCGFAQPNRMPFKSFRGPKLEEGLKCEVVARVADIIQIPVFLDCQEDLLVAAAKTRKIINIMKGQILNSSDIIDIAEKVRFAGNQNVMICEQGTMLEHYDFIVDQRNLERLRDANCPVVADITYSLRKFEAEKVHDDPLNAPVDGSTQWPLRHLAELLEELIIISRASKGKRPFELDIKPFFD